MKRNPLFSVVMMAAALGAAACGDRAQEEPVVTEEPQAEFGQEPEIQVDPAVTEGAVIMDTSAVGTVVTPDTAPRP